MSAYNARALEIHLGVELHRRSAELTRLWLVSLVERLALRPHRVFPSESLLNSIPDLLRRIAEYLLSGGGELQEEAVQEELARLARLRREQGYDIDEILAEFDLLGEILYQALREEARSFDRRIAPEHAIAVAERLNRALMAIAAITADTFRQEGFRDRRERARLLGDFGRTLAHELRTHLGAGQAALARLAGSADGGPLDGEQAEALCTLQTTLEQLDGLSEHVLALAIAQGSEEGAQGRRLALPALVSQAILGLEPLALEREVRLEVADPLPDVPVDAARVELVLLNLLGNAIKYCDPAKPRRWARIAADRDGTGFWRIEVTDNGLGIPPESHEAVFERFVRAHPEVGEGTGLGLAIAREAVRQMGGEIGLASAAGAGTTVWFTVVDPPEARD
jgi:signal transduction histidine kinase